jgi:catechol 2,3-dioxygenase-like lactoylglutathione lyase family enzyme
MLVDDVVASSRFYQDHLGFLPKVESDWFTTLCRANSADEVAFVSRGHELVPERFRDQSVAGMILGLVVEDATREEARLRGLGVEIVQPLRDEPFGQRHFYLADLNGVLVDVIELIPVAPEWAP